MLPGDMKQLSSKKSLEQLRKFAAI